MGGIPAVTHGMRTRAGLMGITQLERLAELQAAQAPAIVLPAATDPGERDSAPQSPDKGPRRRPIPPGVRLGPAALGAILAGQAAFALHLARLNTAFIDEALYLWAGHLEWAHWLHGYPVPAFPSYFSGAPVIYPPLGALADSAGGLAGARLLSLCFMLAATALLYATAARLAGRTAGLLAAALWAFTGPTLHLSAFATYDALSLLLMAVSVWCVVRANGNRDAAGWLLGGALALAASNATAYSSAIFGPVVVAVAFLACPGRLKLAGMRAAALAAYATAALVLPLATAGGGLYYAGIAATVVHRTPGTDPAPVVLGQAWVWSMAVAVPAVAGVFLAVTLERRRRAALFAVLACAALVVPLQQARIHTAVSLDKHVDFGLWFAAVTAGYGLAKILSLASKAPGQKWVALAAVAVTVLVPARYGYQQARGIFGSWPDAAAVLSVLGPVTAHTTGPMLIEASPIGEYYLRAGHDWRRWSSGFSIIRASGGGFGRGVGQVLSARDYAPLVASGYFSVIALNFSNSVRHLDYRLAALLNHSRAYHLVATVPYGNTAYTIWQRS